MIDFRRAGCAIVEIRADSVVTGNTRGGHCASTPPKLRVTMPSETCQRVSLCDKPPRMQTGPLCPQVAWIPTSRRSDPCLEGHLPVAVWPWGHLPPWLWGTSTRRRHCAHRSPRERLSYRWCGAVSTRAPSALVSFDKIITGCLCDQILRPRRRVDRTEAHVPPTPTALVVAHLIGRRMRSRRDREPRRRRPTRSHWLMGYELHGAP
jgi:hypothetical protein